MVRPMTGTVRVGDQPVRFSEQPRRRFRSEFENENGLSESRCSDGYLEIAMGCM